MLEKPAGAADRLEELESILYYNQYLGSNLSFDLAAAVPDVLAASRDKHVPGLAFLW